MTNPLDMSVAEVEHWSKIQNEEFRKKYMTSKEVEQTFNVCMARQSQLIKAGKIIVVRDGQRVYYDREYAVWWFGAYTAQLQAKAAEKGVKKSRKPKKGAAYTYEFGNVQYTDKRPFETVEQEWRVKIASYYPQYFANTETAELKPDVSDINLYPSYYQDVGKYFRELQSIAAKLRVASMK